MNDFIEKPSRMILFIVGIIALITVIILLLRSGLINTGGESLVDANGRALVTKAPKNPVSGNEVHVEEDAEYEEVYIDDGYEENVWVEDPADTEDVYIEAPEEQTEETPTDEQYIEEPLIEDSDVGEETDEPEEIEAENNYEEDYEDLQTEDANEEGNVEIWDETGV